MQLKNIDCHCIFMKSHGFSPDTSFSKSLYGLWRRLVDIKIRKDGAKVDSRSTYKMPAVVNRKTRVDEDKVKRGFVNNQAIMQNKFVLGKTKFNDSCISCIKIYEQDTHLSSPFLHFCERISPSQISPPSQSPQRISPSRLEWKRETQRERESWLWQREAAGAVASAGAWRDTEASAGLGDGREREREPQLMERERERERERPGSRLIGCPGGNEFFPRFLWLPQIPSGQPGCPDSRVLKII